MESSDREKTEIFISCRSLIDTDTFSKTDAFVIVSVPHPHQLGKWTELHRTETIMDNLNPNFTKSVVIEHIFEIQQPLKFVIYDYDGPGKSEYIGEIDTSLGQIVGSKNSTLIMDIKNKKQKMTGKIILRAEKVNLCNDEVTLKFHGSNIKDLRFWSKSSPFLVFYRASENKQQIKTHHTETVENNLNPQFQPIQIKAQKICNGDYDMPILVECWDHHSNGKHEIIGSATFSLKEVNSKQRQTIQLINKKSGDKVGILKVIEAVVKEKPTFLDYVRGGMQLNLVCAIDFTGSNGVPSRPESLHAISSQGMNQYQQAIHYVGEILLNYDSDKMVPFYGFGAKPKLPHFSFNQVLHCFPINGNPQNPEVYNLNGMMETYTHFLNYVELAGPTLFNPLIQESMRVAQVSKQLCDQNYYILLILTDGEIHDMESTTISIVDSSHLPLSIIIIGIGNADFTKMQILDGDEGLIDTNGRKAARDLVQFVPFNKFKDNPQNLAKEVLAELPDQVVEYNQLIGKLPQKANFQRMQSIQANNIPVANSQFGSNQNKAGFYNNNFGQDVLYSESSEYQNNVNLQGSQSNSSRLLNSHQNEFAHKPQQNQPKGLYIDYMAPPPPQG